MAERLWEDVIIEVLKSSKEPLHYQDITERILTGGLKKTAGATPAATVNAQIAASIKHDGAASPYIRVARGMFTLRSAGVADTTTSSKIETDEPVDEIVRAFGMYWQRDLVMWRRQPKLFGRQQVGAKAVDFCGQQAVYVLYDHHSVMYVGRSVDRPLGQRLYEHTLDRLSGRWNRFSWFGLLNVSESGKIEAVAVKPSPETILATLEALLIETLEPPQNRRRGDDFTAVEYIQDIDPELREQQLQHTLRSIEQKMRETPR